MKTPKLLLTTIAATAACFGSLKAQDLPSDLTPISAEDAPVYGTYWSLSHYPDYPPCPMNCWNPAGDLYYSPSVGPNTVWVDDNLSTSGRMTTESFDYPPDPGGDSGNPADDPWASWDTQRNYAKFAGLVFSIIDTNAAVVLDTNLYTVCVSFPPDTNTYPTLQIKRYSNSVVIKANHFDYSAETRDFALIICDNVSAPIMKSIDLLRSSDAQDGWLVEGSIPAFKVADPMFLMVSNITSVRDSFFKAIPYGGPQIDLSGANPYDVVSNILTLHAAITDLSGVTNDSFTLNVDGAPVRYTVTSNNTLSIDTEYNLNGYGNLYLNGLSSARVYNATNPPDQARLVFSSSTSLPLDFENDTFLAYASDNCSPDVGTNYILFGINKAQTVEATIWNPANGQVLSTYSNYFPFAGTVAVPWNFTMSNGVTPYTNDTYAVTFVAFDPATLVVTNTIERAGVRQAAGCFLTYQWVDPGYPTYDGDWLDEQMTTWIKGTLSGLYESVYSSLGLPQYTTLMVGANRNHGGCKPYDSFSPGWNYILSELTNANYSDLTLGPAHGSGAEIGGGQGGFLPEVFNPSDLRRWVQGISGTNQNWRLRKSALWTCYSGSVTLATGGFYNLAWPDACGIPSSVDQTKSQCRKNCGLFFGGELGQRGFGGSFGTSSSRVQVSLDTTWMCGKYQYSGGCDPTYSFAFAVNATRGMYNPELDWGSPLLFGCPNSMYTPNYDDELMGLNWNHVKTH